MVTKWGISGVDSSCSRVAQCRENLSLALEILGWAQWLHQGSPESLGILMEGGLLRLNCTGKLGVTGICYVVCEVVVCPFSLIISRHKVFALMGWQVLNKVRTEQFVLHKPF